jgi:hypothetical protein
LYFGWRQTDVSWAFEPCHIRDSPRKYFMSKSLTVQAQLAVEESRATTVAVIIESFIAVVMACEVLLSETSTVGI